MKKLLPFVLLLAACSKPRLPDVQLARVDGGLGSTLKDCPSDKCLTIVVTPWCGVCHTAVPHLQALRAHQPQTTTTRIVVGHADTDKVKAFAQQFGPDTLLDPEGQVKVDEGIPLFYVTGADGGILKKHDGFPSGPTTPEAVSAVLGLSQ